MNRHPKGFSEEFPKEQGELLLRMVEETVRKVLDGYPLGQSEDKRGTTPAPAAPDSFKGVSVNHLWPGHGEDRQQRMRMIEKAAAAIGLRLGRGLVVFTASQPGEGTSTLSSWSALALASFSGGNVLLLEANLRRPGLYRIFQADPTPGLVEVLTGKTRWQEAVRRTDQVNFYLLPAGGPGPVPDFQSNAQALETLIPSLKSEFEKIVVDAPPLLEDPIGQRWLSWAEASVLVIQGGVTSREKVQQTLRVLKNHKDFLGALFNQAPHRPRKKGKVRSR